MTTVNLKYVQDHLAELVDKAAQGESFIIERGGKPLVKVTGWDSVPNPTAKRTGFMRGQIQVPDDFDTVGGEKIAGLFEELRREWKARRGASSSITDMSMQEPYQRIIGLGESAVPLILTQLKAEGDEPDQWFWALRMLTGENPVKLEDQGDFVAMAKAWISWGERNSYAW